MGAVVERQGDALPDLLNRLHRASAPGRCTTGCLPHGRRRYSWTFLALETAVIVGAGYLGWHPRNTRTASTSRSRGRAASGLALGRARDAIDRRLWRSRPGRFATVAKVLPAVTATLIVGAGLLLAFRGAAKL